MSNLCKIKCCFEAESKEAYQKVMEGLSESGISCIEVDEVEPCQTKDGTFCQSFSAEGSTHSEFFRKVGELSKEYHVEIWYNSLWEDDTQEGVHYRDGEYIDGSVPDGLRFEIELDELDLKEANEWLYRMEKRPPKPIFDSFNEKDGKELLCTSYCIEENWEELEITVLGDSLNVKMDLWGVKNEIQLKLFGTPFKCYNSYDGYYGRYRYIEQSLKIYSSFSYQLRENFIDRVIIPFEEELVSSKENLHIWAGEYQKEPCYDM